MGTAVHVLIPNLYPPPPSLPPPQHTYTDRGLLSFQPCSVDNSSSHSILAALARELATQASAEPQGQPFARMDASHPYVKT